MSKKGPKLKYPDRDEVRDLAPPEDLDPVGLEEWHSTCADLKNLGTLHKTDAKMIALYASTFSLTKRIETQLATEDLSFFTENGIKLNPLVNSYATLVPRLRQLLNDLGLSAKTRKVVENADPGDKWKDIL